MPKEVVTSFRVDEELWREARIYAIENKMSMKELLESLLKTELKKETRKRTK